MPSRKIIGEDIKDVEFSWPIGMPLVQSLGKGLWEVRSNLPGNRIAHVLFCVTQSGNGSVARLHKEDPKSAAAGHHSRPKNVNEENPNEKEKYRLIFRFLAS